MGNNQAAVQYSRPYSTEKQAGFSHIYRTQNAFDGLAEMPNEQQPTVQEIWANSVEKYGDRPYVWTRAPGAEKFDAKTYKEVNEVATQIGSAIINLKLAPVHKEYKKYALKFVGIFAPNREEWCILDMANCLYGNTMIPLYDSHGPENVTYVLKHTNMETCFAVSAKIKTICECKDIGKLKNLVLLNECDEELKKKAEAKGLKVYTWGQLLEEGKKNIQEKVKLTREDIFTFSYTSGTTGDPKGVMLSQKNFSSLVITLQSHPSIGIRSDDRHMSYLPAAHVLERIVMIACMSLGASIYFSAADPVILKQDLLIIKPTFFVSVPRLYNKFYDAISGKLKAATGVKKMLAEKAVKTKLEYLQSGCFYSHKLWDKLIFDKVKIGTFGGCIRFMITGSAPLSKEVCDFLKIAVGCPLIEGYGQTESTGATFSTWAEDPNAGHVGGPTINTEFCLEDVPDMNYTSEDKDEKGINCPRGEVCFRGPGVMEGYYKNQEKTDEAIDKQGWLHSGDIGVILPNGALKLIDRKKNLFKLCQGEYLAPEKIEQTLIRNELIDEIWIHGDSLQSYCIAMIHPNEDFLKKLGTKNNKGDDYAALCADKDINKIFQDELVAFGKKEKLAGFEIPRKIHLEVKSIQQLGGITASFKIQRAECKKIFAKQIEQLYKEE